MLNGDLVYDPSISRLPLEDERLVLLAMHQTLVKLDYVSGNKPIKDHG